MDFKKYYNRSSLSGLLIVVLIALVPLNLHAFHLELKPHLIIVITSVIILMLNVTLLVLEDKRSSSASANITKSLNTVLPLFDKYLRQNSPDIIYVSYKLSGILSANIIGGSLILSWWNTDALKLVDTIIIVDQHMQAYDFACEKSTPYINSIDDLYEKKN